MSACGAGSGGILICQLVVVFLYDILLSWKWYSIHRGQLVELEVV